MLRVEVMELGMRAGLGEITGRDVQVHVLIWLCHQSEKLFDPRCEDFTHWTLKEVELLWIWVLDLETANFTL
jgi:hypothetical protein